MLNKKKITCLIATETPEIVYFCKAQLFCLSILRAALQLLGLKADPKDKTFSSYPNVSTFIHSQICSRLPQLYH